MCSGEAYSVVKCSNFSLATALQAAIALEEYDDVEEVETSSGSKRKREDIEDAEGYGDFWGEGMAHAYGVFRRPGSYWPQAQHCSHRLFHLPA